MGSVQGLVAVVTGGGRGIGREHALLLARLGASVVVNDLGVAGNGTGSDPAPAELVAKEIKDAGGSAVASASSVADWAQAADLVSQAVDTFGRLDIVINNAGILRDSFIASISEQEWDAVIDTNLKGHAAMLHHAAAYWKSQSKAGRAVDAAVVNTASSSGVTKVLAGQLNYAAAKAGIVAMTQVAAAELSRYGVRANAIAPAARTRLTLATPGIREVIAEPSDGGFDAYAPGHVAPLAVYLASPGCTLTGQVFTVRGGSISALSGWAPHRTIETEGPWRLEELPALLSPALPSPVG